MSGILDNKRRVIDVFLTQEGRRQISTGDLKIESFTFSDAGIRYAPDQLSGSVDATSMVHFEACNLPQDSITFESNEDGYLMSFKNKEGIQVNNGDLIQYSEDDDVPLMSLLKGTELDESGSMFLSQTIENFKKLRAVATRDDLFDTDGFGIGTKNITFLLTDEKPLNNKQSWQVNVNKEESLFNDPRLSNAINFRFLPPINKAEQNVDKTNHLATKKYQLAKYPKLGKTNVEEISYDQLRTELNVFSSKGYEKTIKFDPTTKTNNLIVQAFEKKFNKLLKLDIIDFGRYQTGDRKHPFANVYFMGRLLTDDNDTHTFIHLFTLIFEE